MHDTTMQQLHDHLTFFGKVNASISHELKNVLATVSETAGLMTDFVELAQEGGPLNLTRFGALCERIVGQVGRGNAIIRNMNRFAHSVDEAVAPVDLAELTQLMVLLFERFAMLRGAALQVGELKPVTLSTAAFFVQHLVFRCLILALTAVESGDQLRLGVEPTGEGQALFTLAPVRMEPALLEQLPRELCALLAAECSVDPAAGCLQLRLGSLEQPRA